MFNFRRGKSPEELAHDKDLTAQKEMYQFNAALADDRDFLEMRRQNEDLVKWQQDLSTELVLLCHDLKREILDDDGSWSPLLEPAIHPETGQYMRAESGDLIMVAMPPLCNDLCVHMVKAECRPLMSRNLIMSNFSEERILLMLKRTINAIIINICSRFEEYDIHFADISPIISMVKNVIDPAPFRSLDNGERKHLGTINKRIETHSDAPVAKKRGFLGLGG